MRGKFLARTEAAGQRFLFIAEVNSFQLAAEKGLKLECLHLSYHLKGILGKDKNEMSQKFLQNAPFLKLRA